MFTSWLCNLLCSLWSYLTLIVSVHFCSPSFPGQAGLVLWWNMEQRGRSADTVSCQPLSASESLRESHSRSSTDRPTQNMISFFCGPLFHWVIVLCVCVHLCCFFNAGCHVPVKHTCFQFTWLISCCPVPSSTPPRGPYWSTWLSTGWSSSHIHKHRRSS